MWIFLISIVPCGRSFFLFPFTNILHFIIYDDGEAILQFVPEPLIHWLSTFNAINKSLIEKLAKENPNLSKLDILEKLVFGE